MTILNANEYITKGEAVQVLHTAYAEGRIQAKDGCASVLDDIGALKVADVQPIRHGRWTWDSNAPYREHGAYKCSNCGCHSDFKENYCYNCGARMDIIYEDDKIRAIKVTG